MGERVSQQDIVAAWLEAGSASPRFQDLLLRHVPVAQAPRQTLAAYITQLGAGEQHALLLKARPHIALFPWDNVSWQQHTITAREELAEIRTGGGINWLAFSGGTRRLKDAAEWIIQQPAHLDPHVHVQGVMRKIAAGEPLPSPIAYQPHTDDPIVLWEGHARSVAYYLSEHTNYPLTIFMAQPQDNSAALAQFDPGRNEAEIRQWFMEEHE
jgi:hypothetical protein